MSKAGMYLKLFVVGGIVSVGGPAFVYYISPTEEELVKTYNPDLRRRSQENRLEKQEAFKHFTDKLKEYSRSDKPIWVEAALDEQRTRARKAEEQRLAEIELQKRREEIRKQSISGE